MNFIRNFFTPPIFADDPEKTRVARSLFTILNLGVLVSAGIAIFFFVAPPGETKPINFIFQAMQIILWPLLIYLNRTRWSRVAAFVYVFFVFCFVSASLIISADISQTIYLLGFVLVLALATLLLSPTAVYGYFGIIVFMLAGVQVAVQERSLIPAAITLNPIQTIILYSFLLLILTFILGIASNTFQGTTKQVIINDKQLTEKNVELESSLKILEARIFERSKMMERRNRQLQAAAEAGKAITLIRNIDQLLNETCAIISEKFEFYHVGIFLLDPAADFAVLQASNSEGGKKMLERKHKLKVGERGMVGNVTQSGKARIALDVGHDAVFFNNPDLPDTHSEMALPITIGDIILGALDVQSIETGAFSNEDIATLQILADQLAVGIQNARLFEENQITLEASRRAYGELSRADWQKLLKTQGQSGYIGGAQGVAKTSTLNWEQESMQAMQSGDLTVSSENKSIGIPVKIRGQSIGAIRMRKQDNSEPWNQEETSMALIFSEQLSDALENARLYQEAQTRASREAIVSEISARINATPNIEIILKETVSELGQALGNATVSLQLIDPSTPKKISGNGE